MRSRPIRADHAKHGWVPTDSADAAANERHYQTLLALFDATLKKAPPKG